MRSAPLICIATLGLSASAFCQQVSLGVVGGGSLTADFHTLYFDNGQINVFSNTGDFVLGPALEVNLFKRFSLEVDALHRNLNWYAPPPIPGSCQCANMSTWEFPILLRHYLVNSKVSPFVEGGVSFRTVSNKAAADPSSHGLAVGVGAKARIGHLDISPMFRYTRWGVDAPMRLPSIRDQLEMLVGVDTVDTPWSRRSIAGHKLWFGVLGGGSLTGAFPALGQFSSARSYVFGISLETEFGQHWGVEADGLYRPLPTSEADRDPTITWEIPVLAKYSIRKFGAQPFVEFGPSFRLSGNFNSAPPSTFGVTAAGGVSIIVRSFRIEPSIRYTRWEGTANAGFLIPLTNRPFPNQVEALVGFSF